MITIRVTNFVTANISADNPELLSIKVVLEIVARRAGGKIHRFSISGGTLEVDVDAIAAFDTSAVLDVIGFGSLIIQ